MRYWQGDQADIPVDHVFIRTGCFEFIEPVEGQPPVIELKPQPLPELRGMEKRGRGRPREVKKEYKE
jgi:hypothetical protein